MSDSEAIINLLLFQILLQYNVLVSGVQQSESHIYIYMRHVEIPSHSSDITHYEGWYGLIPGKFLPLMPH